MALVGSWHVYSVCVAPPLVEFDGFQLRRKGLFFMKGYELRSAVIEYCCMASSHNAHDLTTDSKDAQNELMARPVLTFPLRPLCTAHRNGCAADRPKQDVELDLGNVPASRHGYLCM